MKKLMLVLFFVLFSNSVLAGEYCWNDKVKMVIVKNDEKGDRFIFSGKKGDRLIFQAVFGNTLTET